MERLLHPPGRNDTPYILGAFGGENIYVPTSAGTTRNLVTADESKNTFLICGGGGVVAPFPVPFHYHNETRHDFLCLKGQMKVWLNDQCRVLNAGDYASVAPKAKHSYQLIGDHTEHLGIVVPGGWEKFFRFIDDIYDGPLWPDVDMQNPRETLVPRVVAAGEQFDVVTVRDHAYAQVQPWDPETDHLLRGNGDPYFLQNGRGPNACLGGTVVRPIATGAETDNKFTLGSIEGSYVYKTQALGNKYRFPTTPHLFFVAEGYVQITVNDEPEARLGPSESIFLPAGTTFGIHVESRYVKLFSYSAPGGLVDLLYEAGKETPHTGPNCMIPESPQPWDKKTLAQLKSRFDFELL
ncbi:RmlC-like cupin [Sarocladium strictum]